MSMSRDRVRFRVSANVQVKTGFRQLFRDCFGKELPIRCEDDDEIVVICRPSQFARFLIERNNRGMCNGFKELRPELIRSEPEPRIVCTADQPNNPSVLQYSGC